VTRLLVFVIIAVVGAAAFTFSPLNGKPAFYAEFRVRASPETGVSKGALVEPLQLPLTSPVTLIPEQASNLRLFFDAESSSHSGVFKITASGADFRLALYDSDAFVRYIWCRKPKGGKQNVQGEGIDGTSRTCRKVLRLSANSTPSIVAYATDGEVKIEAVEFESVTSKHSTAVTSSLLFAGFAFLFLSGPVFVWLRKWPSAERWASIAVGAAWIGFAGVGGLLVVMLFIAISYLGILALKASENKTLRKLGVILTLVALALVFIKFVAPSIANAFANPGGFALALPLGISYFAIKLVDVLLNIYSGAKVEIGFERFLAFMLLPQTLPAGPILTYDQYKSGTIEGYNVVDFAAGGARMTVGLLKKICADSLLYPWVGQLTVEYLSAGPDVDPATVSTMLLVNLAFVYIDFSAYSDLAIGAGRCAGRRIPENFNWPLIRSGIRAYWRHWHMSLSNWVMRRVYFPAFLSSRSTTLSLVGSMMVIGLWHAPNLSWVAWAFHHGLGMAFEGKLFGPPSAKVPWDETNFYRRGVATLRYAIGIIFVWIWVALGHAFTMFSNFEFALQTYLKALSFPFSLI
jgi:alginate O-acetyltransferase complex protein AlgI